MVQYKLLESTYGYEGFFKLEVLRLQHELFAGGWSPPIIRECLERGHAVAVLPYDPLRDEVVLIEQFRIGALHTPSGPWLLEVVAGIIKPGEARLDVARRETQEEIGCELLDSVPICEYLVSPGGTSENIALYCGWIDASQAGGIHGLAEEHEDIRAQVLPRQEALQLLRSGQIISATPLIALQWLETHYLDLQTRWGQNAE
ncbi:MAG: NUDIX domain-containing protein [Candidatus Competibacteraceae bacterium]|nr:NUDIX domain-containing protein [Candidatus Competibacteraceae bacterium]